MSTSLEEGLATAKDRAIRLECRLGKEMKPLKPTKKQKQAIVKALDEFHNCVFEEAADPSGNTYAGKYDARLALLALLGITEEEWREM